MGPLSADEDDEERPGSVVEDAVLITDALVIPGSGDPHWDESARTIIEGVILEVATAKRFDGRRNLVTVRDLLAEGDTGTDPESGETLSGLEVLEGYMRASREPAVRRAAADFFERPDRERDSVLSTARRHLRALAFPEIAASLSGEGFDLAGLKTSRMTVYLCLPGRHMGTCGRWLRLFVNLALQAMERTPGYPAAGSPVLFILDEFASLGHMRQIEDAAGQIASYGVKLWPILQDLGQLKALYKERWETFMGNAGVLQFFGNNDLTTLEWISKRLGATTIEQQSGSTVTPDAKAKGARGESWSLRTTAVMEPDEIALRFGRADPLLRQLDHSRGLRADDFATRLLRQAFRFRRRNEDGCRESRPARAPARKLKGASAMQEFGDKPQLLTSDADFPTVRIYGEKRPKGPLFSIVFMNPEDGNFLQKFLAVAFFAPVMLAAPLLPVWFGVAEQMGYITFWKHEHGGWLILGTMAVGVFIGAVAHFMGNPPFNVRYEIRVDHGEDHFTVYRKGRRQMWRPWSRLAAVTVGEHPDVPLELGEKGGSWDRSKGSIACSGISGSAARKKSCWLRGGNGRRRDRCSKSSRRSKWCANVLGKMEQLVEAQGSRAPIRAAARWIRTR